MLNDLKINIQTQLAKGYSKSEIHSVFGMEKEYLTSLATLCNIEMLPDVIFNIALDAIHIFPNYPIEYRQLKYTVIDDSHFKRTKIE